jgi:V8-like Glu-specific endopeptidase
MADPSIWDSVRELVRQQKLVVAVGLLESWLEGRLDGARRAQVRDWLDELILRVADARAVQVETRKGLLTAEQAAVEIRQISRSLLDLLNEIEAENWSSPTMPLIVAPPTGLPASNQEKIIGAKSNLQMLSWLERGLRCGTAVCRLVSSETLGTGFRMQNNLIATNNHVVRSIGEAKKFSAQFFFEENLDRTMKSTVPIELDPTRFWTSELLDVTIVGARLPSTADGGGIASLPLKQTAAVAVGDMVSIIQHPLGGPKQVALTSNEVINIYDHRVQYVTDTLPGSSGAPVFNSAWEVIAIHHAGGNLLKNGAGDSVFANEGIGVSALLGLPEVQRLLQAG